MSANSMPVAAGAGDVRAEERLGAQRRDQLSQPLLTGKRPQMPPSAETTLPGRDAERIAGADGQRPDRVRSPPLRARGERDLGPPTPAGKRLPPPPLPDRGPGIGFGPAPARPPPCPARRSARATVATTASPSSRRVRSSSISAATMRLLGQDEPGTGEDQERQASSASSGRPLASAAIRPAPASASTPGVRGAASRSQPLEHLQHRAAVPAAGPPDPCLSSGNGRSGRTMSHR